ncbi:NADP-dependent oxidoreductase [Periweissella cryptocerci]|uniref:NADP-dependent oxidoreductase n=1 Tax=Periweissella cryptocerci TaxID=2506420 RepID=A0A4P6YU54_9LACO|nr:NADP-dependent oxidoreductase [Periweissella cryptocerci]QBO36304.1 NADP-dependent oxidoreductase [Periweissella cryptocerci]
MQAIQLKEFGDENQFVAVEVAQPAITSKQVLVKQEATAIDPYDVKFAQGLMGAADLPLIEGSSVAGIVVEVGAEVTNFKVGDRVAASPHLKSYAEYVPVGRKSSGLIPANVSFTQAAATVLSGQTAYQAIEDHLQPQAGESILIHAGMGSVGNMAIQLALLRGAKVYTTASSKNADKLTVLGDVTVIDYHTSDFTTVVHDVDYVLDTLGAQTMNDSLKVLKRGGKLVSLVGEPDAALAETLGVEAEHIHMQGSGESLAELFDLLGSGKVHVNIEREVPFNVANLEEGHRLSATGHLDGKYVLTF